MTNQAKKCNMLPTCFHWNSSIYTEMGDKTSRFKKVRRPTNVDKLKGKGNGNLGGHRSTNILWFLILEAKMAMPEAT